MALRNLGNHPHMWLAIRYTFSKFDRGEMRAIRITTEVWKRSAAKKMDKRVQSARFLAKAVASSWGASIGSAHSYSTNRTSRHSKGGCRRDAADQKIRMVRSLRSAQLGGAQFRNAAAYAMKNDCDTVGKSIARSGRHFSLVAGVKESIYQRSLLAA